jgi:hypothetical protein
MRWLCAFTEIRPETRLALEQHVHGRRGAGQVEYRDLNGASDTAYGALVADLWELGLPFAVVEHDVVIRADVVEAFLTCPEAYCAFPYAWTTNVGPALGCTRFGTDLIDALPDAAVMCAGVSWRQFDHALIRRELARNGAYPHLHLPPVEHLNEAQRLVSPFDQMTLEEHLGALGFTVSGDGLTATHHGGESAFR